jgi:HD-GYP domain-containing protein (c-di-GMP phosphodiesterase class II)
MLSILVSWELAPPQISVQLVLLTVAAVLLENFALWLPAYTVSLSYPLAMSAIVLAGPSAASVIAVMCSTNYKELTGRPPLWQVAFNMGQLALSTSIAGWSYVLLGGQVLWVGQWRYVPWDSATFASSLIPMAIAAIVCASLNLFLIAVYGWLLRGESVFEQLMAMVSYLPTQLALAFVGYLIAQVMAITAVGLPLFIAPLVVAQQLYARYAALKDAYADTVRSLIGALEAKDPYTRGHSERVAGYAAELGIQIGLDPRLRERLEYSALLHDIGKLAVPSYVLTKPGRLEGEEIESIRRHPERGAAMVSRIPPLRDLAEYVGKHHEWYGGGGYPGGLNAEEIPLVAQVLSVADCYDAMTTTRAYRSAMSRDDAVAELVRCAGTQFDPDIVRAFIEARVGELEPAHTKAAEGPTGVQLPVGSRD